MDKQVEKEKIPVAPEDAVHCVWCGEELEPGNEKAHLDTHKKEKIIKWTPFFEYMRRYVGEEFKDGAKDELLELFKKFLKKNLVNLFLTVSIVTSAATVIATIPNHIEQTTLTAQEIRYQQLPQEEQQEVLPPAEEEEPVVQEELIITTELMETLNNVSFNYIDIGNRILSGQGSDSELDGVLLERAVGTISDFTVTHDYLDTGYGYYDLDYNASPAKVYASIYSSPLFKNGDPNQGFEYTSDLSAKLIAEGYHVVEYTFDIFVREDTPMDGDYAQHEQMADRAHKYLIVMVEVDGQWYIASDYLTERWGV